MNADQMRIKIAKFCGIDLSKWYCPKCRCAVHPKDVTFYETHDHRAGGCGCELHQDSPGPNYPSDLNAMAEAEKKLTHEQCVRYHNELEKVMATDTQERGQPEYPAQEFWFHTTAAQRAEALCMVIDAQESTD